MSSWCKKCRSDSRRLPNNVRILNTKTHKDSQKVNVLSDLDSAYIAGLLDGEGGISLIRNHSYSQNRKTTCALRVSVSNTHIGVLEWLALKVGYGRIDKSSSSFNTRKVCWCWTINGRRSIDFLKQLYPFLKIKKFQAEVAFEFGETILYPGGELTQETIDIREKLKSKLSVLNVG